MFIPHREHESLLLERTFDEVWTNSPFLAMIVRGTPLNCVNEVTCFNVKPDGTVRILITRFKYYSMGPQHSIVHSLIKHGKVLYLKVTQLVIVYKYEVTWLSDKSVRSFGSDSISFRGTRITGTYHERFEVRTKQHPRTLFQTAATSRKTNEPCRTQPQSNKTHPILQTRIKAICTVRHKTVNDCEKLWGLGFYTFQTLI